MPLLRFSPASRRCGRRSTVARAFVSSARLKPGFLESDRVILGGLNEGTWPPETHADAWLNRPMRRKLGLDLPERRIGLAAHDFAQAMGARELLLTRARKANGVEMVASRFLQRLSAVAPEQAWKEARERGRALSSIWRACSTAPGDPPAGHTADTDAAGCGAAETTQRDGDRNAHSRPLFNLRAARAAARSAR